MEKENYLSFYEYLEAVNTDDLQHVWGNPDESVGCTKIDETPALLYAYYDEFTQSDIYDENDWSINLKFESWLIKEKIDDLYDLADAFRDEVTNAEFIRKRPAKTWKRKTARIKEQENAGA